MSEIIYSMLTGKGPNPGDGQTLDPFTLSGVPVDWAYDVGQYNTNINGTYVDTSVIVPGYPPGFYWLSADFLWVIMYMSDLGTCNCFTETNVSGRALGGGWGLYEMDTGKLLAYANGSINSKPPSGGWGHIHHGGMWLNACSANVDDPYTYVGFQDCDPSISPPTQPYHPGYVANLTFTSV